MSGGWIGVDLDGTLAHYDGWKGVEHIGEPVPAMLERVKAWLAEGRDVRIFTARVYRPVGVGGIAAEAAIEAWCLEHVGRVLPITCVKDMNMVELWDDRAVGVEKNTGQPVGISPDGRPWWRIAQLLADERRELLLIKSIVKKMLERRPSIVTEETLALDHIINPKAPDACCFCGNGLVQEDDNADVCRDCAERKGLT